MLLKSLTYFIDITASLREVFTLLDQKKIFDFAVSERASAHEYAQQISCRYK